MSVAASGGLVGVSLSIGVGVAYNEIDTDVAAFIKDTRPESAGPTTFIVGAIILATGLAVTLLVNNKPLADKN